MLRQRIYILLQNVPLVPLPTYSLFNRNKKEKYVFNFFKNKISINDLLFKLLILFIDTSIVCSLVLFLK